MAEMKVLTVRMCPDDAHRAEMVARTEGVSVNEVFSPGVGALLRAQADRSRLRDPGQGRWWLGMPRSSKGFGDLTGTDDDTVGNPGRASTNAEHAELARSALPPIGRPAGRNRG